MSDWIREEYQNDLLKFDSYPGPEDLQLDIHSEDISLELEVLEKKPKDTLAKKFVNLLGQGYKPGEAAKLVGTSIRGIMSQKAFREKVRNLVETYNLAPEIRTAMVRAGLNQIALEGLQSTDPGEKKLGLEALKAIAGDTQVGINAAPAPAVQINVGSLQELFTSLDNNDTIVVKSEFPDEVVDVEVIENKDILNAEDIRKLAPPEEDEEA